MLESLFFVRWWQCFKILVLSIFIFSSFNLKADQIFGDRFRQEVDKYKQVEREYYEVLAGYENKKITFSEELKLTDAICKFIASQKKYQKFMVDNFDQLQLIFSDETSASSLAEKFEKEIKHDQEVIDKFTDTPYECGKQNYLKLK